MSAFSVKILGLGCKSGVFYKLITNWLSAYYTQNRPKTPLLSPITSAIHGK